MWICSMSFSRTSIVGATAFVTHGRRSKPSAVQPPRSDAALDCARPIVISRQREHGVLRPVVPAPVIGQLVARVRRDAPGVSEDRPRDRLVAEVRQHQHFVREVLGRVLRHGDFLDHDALFLLQLAGVERRRDDQVRQHVHRQRQVLVDDLRVKAGAFLRGERVELAAHGVHLLGDRARGALLRALEHHVLDEVARARLRGDFKLRARADPQPDRNRPEVRDPLADDAQAVAQRGLIKVHVRFSSYAKWTYPVCPFSARFHSVPIRAGRGRETARAPALEGKISPCAGRGRRGGRPGRPGRRRGAGDGAPAWTRRRRRCRCARG